MEKSEGGRMGGREGGREGERDGKVPYLEGALGGNGMFVLEHDVHEALQLLVYLWMEEGERESE